jgi:hypothetical protein
VIGWFANAIEAGRLAGTSEAYAKNPARPDTLTGVVAPPPKICHAPLAPMVVGSTCAECGHHSLAHSDNGPCMLCVMQAKLG